MEIHISIRTTEPLAGSATTGRRGPLPFDGWLELLGVLATLIAPQTGSALSTDPTHVPADPDSPSASSSRCPRPPAGDHRQTTTDQILPGPGSSTSGGRRPACGW